MSLNEQAVLRKGKRILRDAEAAGVIVLVCGGWLVAEGNARHKARILENRNVVAYILQGRVRNILGNWSAC